VSHVAAYLQAGAQFSGHVAAYLQVGAHFSGHVANLQAGGRRIFKWALTFRTTGIILRLARSRGIILRLAGGKTRPRGVSCRGREAKHGHVAYLVEGGRQSLRRGAIFEVWGWWFVVFLRAWGKRVWAF